MNELLQRLKERKLVQWALAYAAATFAFLQGIDIVARRFGWPEQTMRLVSLLIDPLLQGLHSDPRYHALLAKTGLPTSL